MEIFAEIARFFGQILSSIYGVIPNLGISIIILTIMVKLVTFPLNNKQIQSARRMQKLQPEIKKIQQKYKNDKEKQNKAVMEFMQENKVNPLAGCLPLLVQFPVLIGIFQLLRQIETIMPDFDFNPYFIPIGEGGYINLLALANSSVGLYVFPIIAGATTYAYSKLSMADSGQKMMLYLMPAMITFFSFQFPVGLVIYWIMNNLFSVGQHFLVNYFGKMKEGAGSDSNHSEEKGKKGAKGKK